MSSRYGFSETAHGVDETHYVAPGYSADVLIRWVDPVVPGASKLDPYAQDAETQTRQFGYKSEPIPRRSTTNAMVFRTDVMPGASSTSSPALE